MKERKFKGLHTYKGLLKSIFKKKFPHHSNQNCFFFVFCFLLIFVYNPRILERFCEQARNINLQANIGHKVIFDKTDCNLLFFLFPLHHTIFIVIALKLNGQNIFFFPAMFAIVS